MFNFISKINWKNVSTATSVVMGVISMISGIATDKNNETAIAKQVGEGLGDLSDRVMKLENALAELTKDKGV